MSIQEEAPGPLSTRALVAAKVRGVLAERRISINSLPARLGRESSRYWYRRINDLETALDVDDLGDLARLLDVDPAVFFGAQPPKRGGGGSRGRLPTGPYAGQLVLLPNFEDLHQESIAQPDAA